MQEIKQLLQGYKLPENKAQREYWQIRCLEWCDKLSIENKNRASIFKLFKKNLCLMESICAYVHEAKNVRNPFGYVLYEYKRRKKQNML